MKNIYTPIANNKAKLIKDCGGEYLVENYIECGKEDAKH